MVARHSYLTIADVAERRGVDPRTVRRWIAEGLLKAYRQGPRLIRIRPEDEAALDREIPAANVSSVPVAASANWRPSGQSPGSNKTDPEDERAAG